MSGRGRLGRPQRKHIHALRGDGHRVLELRGELSVPCHDRPFIIAQMRSGADRADARPHRVLRDADYAPALRRDIEPI